MRAERAGEVGARRRLGRVHGRRVTGDAAGPLQEPGGELTPTHHLTDGQGGGGGVRGRYGTGEIFMVRDTRCNINFFGDSCRNDNATTVARLGE